MLCETQVPAQFITPNLHVILIHYPLGMLSVGILLELFAFLWRRSSVRTAARWMILIGGLATLPALTSGLYAYRFAISGDVTGKFHDIVAHSSLSSNGDQWEFLRRHIIMNAVGTGLILLGVVSWLGSSDRWRSKLHLIYLLLLVAGMAALMIGAWHGGETVYRWGTGTGGDKLVDPPADLKEMIEYYAPPLQMHVIMAGAVIALTLAALGMSIRRLTHGQPVVVEEAWYESRQSGGQLAPAATPGVMASPSDSSDPFADSTRDAARAEARAARQELRQELATDMGSPVDPTRPDLSRPQPTVGTSAVTAAGPTGVSSYRTTATVAAPVGAARWWVLAMLLALATAVGGIWTANKLTVPGIQALIKYPTPDPITGARNFRDFAHLILGASIAVLALFLAIVVRAARRPKWMLSIFSLLLLVVVAAQVCGGILLMFDTRNGPLTGWDPPGQADAPRPGGPTTAPSDK